MKCIIAGSRSINDYELLVEAFTSCPWNAKITEIVSGTAKGVDRLGEKLATDRNLSIARFPANWNKFGKSAGYKRNEQMGEYADIAIILWDGKSRGTSHMIDIMKKLGKPYIVNEIKDNKLVNKQAKLDEELFRI